MSLLNECLEALGDNIVVLSMSETENVFSIFEDMFPITSWARIDWGKIHNKVNIVSSKELVSSLNSFFNKEELESHPYILWNDASLPAIQAKLEQIVRVIDEVTSVSFDTWIFSPKLGYVIEFYHEGEITLGVISQASIEN
ncbi:CDI toxin immunity protein [Anabaena azotica]|uniref:Uncharacterized protein n=1 Tax=Anabaena azotica FACHB-119 TaxID=947527 RepID=A0ABR8DBT3_9NOST|nr:hypothetical protein [Anabaena azotica]MBD2504564.1 hypothetical protein [Anabaena azotica FACHB-119]